MIRFIYGKIFQIHCAAVAATSIFFQIGQRKYFKNWKFKTGNNSKLLTQLSGWLGEPKLSKCQLFLLTEFLAGFHPSASSLYLVIFSTILFAFSRRDILDSVLLSRENYQSVRSACFELAAVPTSDRFPLLQTVTCMR